MKYSAFKYGSGLLLLSLPALGYAESYYFNPAFLSGDSAAVADLDHFLSGGTTPPGHYKVDVYVDGNFVSTRQVRFVSEEKKTGASNGDSGLVPQFTVAELTELGINPKADPSLALKKQDDIVFIDRDIPEGKTTPDMSALRLDISVPQALMRNDARGYIPPSQWDDGINAMMVNYNFTGNNDWYDSGNAQSQFLSLQSGLNLGAWRLRDNSTWNRSVYTSGDTTSEWQHISTYAERAIPALQGELSGGDISTSGTLFDSLPVRGIKLETDDNMLPDSQKGFAPTIRGIAKSNAKVTIKQNGYTLYQTYVPPGAFVISDLFPTSSSGDLQVTVSEKDGSSQTYTVPFSSVPGLQREDHIKYSVTAGKYHNDSDMQDEPDFVQGTVFWGGPYGFTWYGGGQFSENYQSVAFGMGKNLGELGAVTLDLTQADSTLTDGSSHTGQSVRFLYAKSLNQSGTTLNLTGYRYSTEGFYTLSDTTYKMMSGYDSPDDTSLDDRDQDDDEPDYASYYNLWYTKKGKLQASLNQSLKDWGSMYVSATEQTYWHTDEEDRYLQAGFSSSIRDINYSLSYSYNRYMSQPEADQMFALSVSIPLGKWLSPSHGDINSYANDAYLTYSNNTDSHGNMTQSAGVSGSLLDAHNLTYNVQQGGGNNGEGANGNASLSYKGTYNNLSAGYNYNDDSQQVNYGLNGGVVLHRNGITFSQPLGDTNILVAAPGAGGVALENNAGVTTDWRGYTVIPYANTYRQNRVALDSKTLGNHVDIDNAVINVVPTQGAMVRALFEPKVGVRALMTLNHDGKPLPFGTVVTRDGKSDTSNIVGDDGQVFLPALSPEGTLTAQWGDRASEHCSVHYKLPDDSLSASVVNTTGVCL